MTETMQGYEAEFQRLKAALRAAERLARDVNRKITEVERERDEAEARAGRAARVMLLLENPSPAMLEAAALVFDQTYAAAEPFPGFNKANVRDIFLAMVEEIPDA